MLLDQMLAPMMGKRAQAEIAQRETARQANEREVRKQCEAERRHEERARRVAERRRHEERARRVAVDRLQRAVIGVRAAGFISQVNLRHEMGSRIAAMKRAPSVVR